MFRLRTLAIIAATLLLSSCGFIKPWVKSHERGILADPVMAFEQNAASTRYMNHVYEARESARGAEGSAGGGCGCN